MQVEYVYDLVGKIQQVTDPTGTYGFAYDNMGRLVGTTTQYSFLPSTTYTNAYTYDAASNRTGFTAPYGNLGTDGTYPVYFSDNKGKVVLIGVAPGLLRAAAFATGCHPERSSGGAKRRTNAVEGALTAGVLNQSCEAF